MTIQKFLISGREKEKKKNFSTGWMLPNSAEDLPFLKKVKVKTFGNTYSYCRNPFYVYTIKVFWEKLCRGIIIQIRKFKTREQYFKICRKKKFIFIFFILFRKAKFPLEASVIFTRWGCTYGIPFLGFYTFYRRQIGEGENGIRILHLVFLKKSWQLLTTKIFFKSVFCIEGLGCMLEAENSHAKVFLTEEINT